jgi:WD40 repeat protein
MIRTSIRLAVLVGLLTIILVLSHKASGAEPPSKPAVDLYGDALPQGAVARLGTMRLRHTGGIWSVALNPDGSLLVTTEYGAVHLWNAKTGEEIERFPKKAIRGEFVTFSPDGTVLLTGNRKGLIQQWEVSSGQLIQEFEETFKDDFLLGTFSPGGSVLALSGSMLVFPKKPETAVLLDVATGHEILRLDKQKAIHGIDVSPDGKLAAVAGTEMGPICLWDTATGKLHRELHGHKNGALWVKFSPNGKLLAGASWRGDLRIWDVSSGKDILKCPEGGEICDFSPDSRILAVSRDGEICLLDVENGRVLRKLEGHNEKIGTVAWSANGRLLAGGIDNTVRLWDGRTGKQLPRLPGHQNWIRSLAFSPDGKSLGSGSDRDGLIVWDVTTSKARHVWADWHFGVNAVAWSPDGSVLAAGESGHNDNREVLIRCFDPREGRLVREFAAHLNEIRSLSFSPDGKQLASVGWDARIRIWDPATGKRLHQIRGSDDLQGARFSRDGKILIVTDREVEFYQTEGWRLLYRLEPEEGEQAASAPLEFCRTEKHSSAKSCG